MSFLRRLFRRPAVAEPEKPFWISFHGSESISDIRKNARTTIHQLGCPNPDELLSECHVVSAGRRFIPDGNYCTKPEDMIFFPRLAAAVSQLATASRLPPEGKERDARLAAEFNDWLRKSTR